MSADDIDCWNGMEYTPGDVLDMLRAHIAGDPVAIMSKANTERVVVEIERLRARVEQLEDFPPDIDDDAIDQYAETGDWFDLRAKVRGLEEKFAARSDDAIRVVAKLNGLRDKLAGLRAELAARDELLQRARQWLPLKEGIDAELEELIASIDAALAKGGGDE